METEAVRYTKLLAKRSLILGILSCGNLVIGYLLGLYVKGFQVGTMISFPVLISLGLFFISLFGNFMLNISGFVIGVIVLVRSLKEENNSQVMRRGLLGIVLCVTSIVIGLFILMS